MKELSKKFSADEEEQSNPQERSVAQPAGDGRPVFHDLRFVVKESLNLGFRFFDEMERVLRKLQEDPPEKKNEQDDPA